MGLFIVTVLGFSVCIGIVGFTIMHYVAIPLNAHDSIAIDPKPSK